MADRAQLLNDAEEAMRVVLDGRQSGIWTAMPAIITKVTASEMTCEVQPAIKGTVEDENGALKSVNLPLLVDCPIVFPGGGGFLMTFPIAVNDEVLVVFSSRCIDAWWQSGGVQRPMEARMHDLSDGFVIPGLRSFTKAVSFSNTTVQIRNPANTAIIELTDTKVILTSSTEIDINAPSVKINGALDVSGAITAAQVTAGSIPLTTHKHTGVTTGGGTSGGPTP